MGMIKKNECKKNTAWDASNEALLAGFNNCRGNPVNGKFYECQKERKKKLF